MTKHFRSCLLPVTALLTASFVHAEAAKSTSSAPVTTANGIRFALTGDSIINRKISVFNAPGFSDMVERIRSADAAFTNFETVMHEFEYPGEALSGGTYMGSPPNITDELKWMGFDLVGTANNHTFDFGVEGMRSNIKYLKESGLTFAGSGETLARARAPAYLDTPKGRVALISCSSSFPPASAAGAQRADMIGRPGLNPLRFTTTYVVDSTMFQSISKLSAMTARAGAEAGSDKSTTFLGMKFEEGSGSAIHTKALPADLEGIATSVRDARQQSDWVMVSIHCHEGLPGKNDEPAEFYVEFAHAMIDAGADMVVGHGPHITRAIEVYKGKPIFYSLGNFLFENDLVLFQPSENYDGTGLPPSAQPSDYFTKRSKGDSVGMTASSVYWEAIIAEPVFDGARNLKSLKLYPVEMGFGNSRPQRGRPYPASAETGRKIIERMDKLSKPYGVSAVFDNGAGVVSWK